jgi:hypothetical protein
MDQKSIVVYLSLNGMTAAEIHADLVATHQTGVVYYGSVTCYLRRRNFMASIDPRQNKLPDPILSELDKTILIALEKQPSPRFVC